MTAAKTRRWTTEELVAVLATFEATLRGPDIAEVVGRAGFHVHEGMVGLHFGQPDAALAYLRRTFRHEVDVTGMDAAACALLSEIFNRWGILVRRGGEPRRAVGIFDVALLAATPQTRQAILYNRGFARLQATVGNLLAGNLRAVAGPRPTVAAWRLCERDFEEAAQLAPNDDAAWAQLGATRLLLAAAATHLPFAARCASAAGAIAAYETCLRVLPAENEGERPAVTQSVARARRVAAALDATPRWRRWLRRVSEIPLQD